MFWGLVVQPGKVYGRVVDESFQVTMVALGPDAKPGSKTSLLVKVENAEYVICTLCAGTTDHQRIDLRFTEGETIEFHSIGDGELHMTGYHVALEATEDDLFDDDDEMEFDEEEEEDAMFLHSDDDGEEGEEEEEEEDGSFDEDGSSFDEEEDFEGEGFVESDESEEFIMANAEEIVDDETETRGTKKRLLSLPAPPAKKEKTDGKPVIRNEGKVQQGKKEEGKKEAQQPKKGEEKKEAKQQQQKGEQPKKEEKKAEQPKKGEQQQKGDKKGDQQQQKKGEEKKAEQPKKGEQQQQKEEKKGEQQKKEEKKPEQPKKGEQQQKKEEKKGEQKKEGKEQPKEQPKASQPKVLAGGLIVEDTLPGKGKQAKNGMRLQMYYTGRLASNNKVFDSCTGGKPFTFQLGKAEVIKGWDQGLAGMSVGGKRRLVIPAALAYGSRGAPPTIPANAKLIFDVELINVK